MTEPVAVADAGPLIHLDEIGVAAVLDIFPTVLVPHEVALEVQRRPKGPGQEALRRCEIRHLAKRDSPPVGALSVADMAAIELARQHQGLLITDDLDLRDTANLAGLQVVGTIGVIVRAGHLGVLPRDAALAALDSLLAESTLFITPNLIQQAKRALES